MATRIAGSEARFDPVAVGLAVALAVLTFLYFAPAGLHDRWNLIDDPEYVALNPVVPDGLTAEGAAWAFGLHGHAANWFPLTWLSHMLDVSLFGEQPGPHKLMNALYHALGPLCPVASRSATKSSSVASAW